MKRSPINKILALVVSSSLIAIVTSCGSPEEEVTAEAAPAVVEYRNYPGKVNYFNNVDYQGYEVEYDDFNALDYELQVNYSVTNDGVSAVDIICEFIGYDEDGFEIAAGKGRAKQIPGGIEDAWTATIQSDFGAATLVKRVSLKCNGPASNAKKKLSGTVPLTKTCLGPKFGSYNKYDKSWSIYSCARVKQPINRQLDCEMSVFVGEDEILNVREKVVVEKDDGFGNLNWSREVPKSTAFKVTNIEWSCQHLTE